MKARINTQKVENLPPKNQISLKSSLERLGGIIKNRVKKKPKKLLIVLILLGPALIAVTIYTVAVRISGVSKPDISPEQTTPPPISQPVTPSKTPEDKIKARPVYKEGELLTFTHFAQNYSIEYPVQTDLKLVGATGGNFALHFEGDTHLYIYPYRVGAQQIANLTLENVTDLDYPDFGGNKKIFPDWEEIVSRERILLGGKPSYKVMSKITEEKKKEFSSVHLEKENENIERFLLPIDDERVLNLYISYNIKNKEVDEILSTFKLIPAIPEDWKTYSDSEVELLKFQFPPNLTLKKKEETANKPYKVTFSGPEGDIIFTRYEEDPEIQEYFKGQDYYTVAMDSAILAEQAQGEDIENLKFNVNAFTFVQGGDYAIRVIHPEDQFLNLYLSPELKVTAPLSMETTLNQMLTSLNEMFFVNP